MPAPVAVGTAEGPDEVVRGANMRTAPSRFCWGFPAALAPVCEDILPHSQASTNPEPDPDPSAGEMHAKSKRQSIHLRCGLELRWVDHALQGGSG